MSDIAIKVAGKETSASGSRVQTANHSAWLEQLESAQWQQRLRYQSHGGGQQRSSDADSDSAREQATLHGMSAESAGADSPTDSHGHATDMSKSAGNGIAQISSNIGTARADDLHQTVALLPVLPQPSSALGDEPGVTMTQQFRRPSTMQWQAQNAHVMLGTEGLRVWLRDARYREGDGQKLLNALRSQFARAGLRLAQFTLNGSLISEPNRID